MKEGVYHAELLTISRGDGRSAPGAIAYRAGIVIEDERTGETFDYRRKRGIRHTEIILPAGAPAQYANRGFLWNAVERIEKHPRATVAREIQIAIPVLLIHEQQLDLVRKFATALVEKHGFAIDFAIHDPDKKESSNVHAHILMTTRRLEAEGFTKKTREWDDLKKLGPQTTKEMRKLLADLTNKALKEVGIDMFVDHRSHKERGLEIAPTKKMGVAATAMERRGESSSRGDENRAILAANVAIAAAKLEYATVQKHIEQLTHAPATPETVCRVRPEPLPLAAALQEAATLELELPMPDQWLKLLPVHERILNGPANNVEPPPVTEQPLQDTRADKYREYAALEVLKNRVTEYAASRLSAANARNAFNDLKTAYDAIRPPRFSIMLKFIGRNEAYDDFAEKKRNAAIAMKEKALQVKALEAKRDQLKPAQYEWDQGGKALRFQKLSKELGYTKQQPANRLTTAPSTNAPSIVPDTTIR